MSGAAKALVAALGAGAMCLASCSGAQTKDQAKLAAIVAGCKESLDIARDGGEAGAADAIAKGCAAELHVWENGK